MDARGTGRPTRWLVAVAAAVLFGLLAGIALAEPPANFVASTDRPRVGERVEFLALVRCGRSDLTCTWDFGDGERAEGQVVGHSYSSPGPRTVSLTVDDGNPEDPPTRGELTIDVQEDPQPPPPPPPPENRSPTAAIATAPTTQARPGQVLTFNPQASDPDGDGLSFEWDFGDGSRSGDARPSHAYGSPGDYRVVVRVRDGRGGEAVDDEFIRVRSVNAGPSAGIGVSNPTPFTAEAVTFTAQAADPDGSIAAYAWDQDGDGFDDGTGPSVTIGFPLPGERRVRLRVTDDAGARAEAEAAVQVMNRRPTVVFEYDPPFIPQGGTATFTSRSSDPEGRLDTQRWDLDGDGEFDDASGSTARATFPGTRQVSVGLRVTDLDGAAADRRVQIVPGNRAPTVAIRVNPDPPQPNQPAELSADVEDPDGSVVKVAWDLDDDGEFDDADAAANVTWTFPTAGPHRIAVEATDNSGSATVVVRELQVGGTVAVASGGARARRRLFLMRPFPLVRVAGSLTRRGAHLRLVSVSARRGTRIAVRCAGRSCERKRLVTRATGVRRPKRLRAFQRTYRAGTRLVIRVTSTRRIGKYTRITIRRGKKPARVDMCVRPGRSAPQRCPS
jgi:PKD repeat protein